jgi:acetyl esterase/lipase
VTDGAVGGFHLIRSARLVCAFAAVASSAVAVSGVHEPASAEPRTLTYASRDGVELLLDLYLPANPIRRPAPVIVFIHGGGWSGGTRVTGPDFRRYFAQDGFAMASIEYRLTPSVTFPANVEDVRTAVRWLKANAAAHTLDPDRICLWGTSAGGHLAAVAALAPPGMFEGSDNLDRTSVVRCVLDAYGPTRFDLMDAQAQAERATLQPAAVTINVPAGQRGAGAPPAAAGGRAGPPAGAGGRGAVPHDDPASPESRLVGGAVPSVPERVRAASPMTSIGTEAPPFLIMHGLADSSVPHGQSVLLYEALKAAGQEVTLRLADGLPHTFFNRSDLDEVAGPYQMQVREHPRGGPEVQRSERDGVFAVAREFFRRHLR